MTNEDWRITYDEYCGFFVTLEVFHCCPSFRPVFPPGLSAMIDAIRSISIGDFFVTFQFVHCCEERECLPFVAILRILQQPDQTASPPYVCLEGQEGGYSVDLAIIIHGRDTGPAGSIALVDVNGFDAATMGS